MVSKVDWIVDSCIIFQKGATVATSRLSIFHGFSLIYFSGEEVAEFVQNGLKILKIFRQSQQSTTWQIRDLATVDFSRES
jgi:hypothetical protein